MKYDTYRSCPEKYTTTILLSARTAHVRKSHTGTHMPSPKMTSVQKNQEYLKRDQGWVRANAAFQYTAPLLMDRVLFASRTIPELDNLKFRG